MASMSRDDVKVIPWIDGAAEARSAASTITLTQPTGTGLGEVALTSPWVKALGQVMIRGAPGEDVGFWRFGFIQLKFITDDWAHYRGPTTADGSVFLALDRPPARPQQLCRDTYDVKDLTDFPILGPIVFYDGDQEMKGNFAGRVAGYLPGGTKIPASGELIMTVVFSDSPSRNYPLAQLNASFNPSRRNNLYSLQTGAAFACMFAVQKGVGQTIEIVKSFQWHVRWRAHFRTTNAGLIEQALARHGDVQDVNVSRVVEGAPQDARFQKSITDHMLPSCNAMMRSARANPYRRISQKWEDWNVKH